MNEKAEARILCHGHMQVLVHVGGVGEGLVLRLLGPVVLGWGGQALEHGGGEPMM